LLAREIAGLSPRHGDRDHKSQTERKYTSEEIRPNDCRLFIHLDGPPVKNFSLRPFFAETAFRFSFFTQGGESVSIPFRVLAL
jgi:hypothetical protein